MILVILFCVTVLLGIVAYIAFKYLPGTLCVIFATLACIVGVTAFILLNVCISVHIPILREQKLTEYEQTYYTISQMINNHDNAVITLTSQIAEYNADVLKGRMMQDSKMLSILDYDFYYDLPLIELK